MIHQDQDLLEELIKKLVLYSYAHPLFNSNGRQHMIVAYNLRERAFVVYVPVWELAGALAFPGNLLSRILR